MSPEQAKGKPVDTRTDVWAFGAVLYEMLAGERAFKGEDVSDTLVSVFRDDPDWAKLPGDVPSRVRNAMRVCSKKDAKERVRDIAAVRLALEGAFETEGAPAGAAERPLSRAALLALAFVAGALVVWAMMPETTHDIGVSRTSIVLPQTQLLTATRRMLAVSPTGTHIAYVANLQLYLRAMDEGEAQPLRGTEASNPSVPFFSSNGQWIGFYSLRDGGLRKIAISGGAAVALCSVERPYGASWGSDGTIVFGQPSGEIFRVSADGGDPERIVAVESGSGRAHGPQILPDGRTLLFTLGRDDWNEAQIVVQSMDTGERRILVDGGTDGRYLPSGHLLYGLEGNLLAVPFDAERLEIRGGPVPVIESVMPAKTSGALNFDVSRDGMLAYVAGTADELRTLVWVDRDGGEEPIAAEARAYDQARVSPDGTKALLDISDQEEDLWVWDFGQETLTRFTFDAGRDFHGEWSRDGEHVFFSSDRGGVQNLHRKAVDGTGVVELLFESPNRQSPFAFIPHGASVVIHDIGGDFLAQFGLSVLSLADEPTVEPLLDTGYFVDDAALSPDGRWLAYASLRSGEMEVYVRPFPNVHSGGIWQISSKGGRYPLWGPDGNELFFWANDEGLMRVSIDASTAFQHGTPESLIERGSYFYNPRNRAFDISPDGERFLMVKQSDDDYAGLTRINVVHNWFEELNARVPVE